ncbi:hypothetical protein [Rhodoferax sp. PAMC 29310]|uniref:hypothetical protein n=1 Tax=Rhodoferax sp. PAMC 29310 TaxID=2822760 RepID=UPI001B33B0CD|nr:hypothetical protein [Rhodoferax sp. PAMC 29310]
MSFFLKRPSFQLCSLGAALAMALGYAGPTLGATSAEELDALNLESAPAESVATQTIANTRFFIEGAIGTVGQRYVSGSRDLGRASLDFSHTANLSSGLKAVVSDRFDYIHPGGFGLDGPVNSLREAYLSWQPESGDNVFEFGRVNLRYGPAYGYNPTDFFRDGALRTLTTADPIALRLNRMGVVMLRGQHLWLGGSLSVAWAPKLANRSSSNGLSLDLGSTNNSDRALVALSSQLASGISGQLLAYKKSGASTTLGVNLTALLSEAAVGHLEWTRGREPDLLSRILVLPGTKAMRNRFSGGLTYTTRSKLSVTAEYEYNGFALSQSDFTALSATPSLQQAYLTGALQQQELAPRKAYLIYVTQKGWGLKDLDLSAYLRYNPGDGSRLGWMELRHHWPKFDMSLQYQRNLGRIASEFGSLPDSRITQVIGTYYF